MDSPRCVVTFDRPGGWDVVTAYASSSRQSFESIRVLRPRPEAAPRILLEFVEQSRFKNVRPNQGYIEALGGGSAEMMYRIASKQESEIKT